MSDVNNPYQSPSANSQPVTPLIPQGTLTESMLKNLSDASPWLRFLGIMGFIGSGVCALTGIVFLVMLPFTGRAIDEFAGGEVWYYINSIGPAFAVYALYFVGAGIVMFFPALFTYRFGVKIRSFVQTNLTGELELAFKNNKALWKFQGILTIIGLAFIPVLIIIVIVVAVAAVAVF